MHGGKSTGPRPPAGLEQSRKANLKHGRYSAESIALQRYISSLLRQSRDTIEKSARTDKITPFVTAG